MRKYNTKIKVMIAIVWCISLLTLTSYAHPGRTDFNGGHKDKNNKSGLGSYHYHCGGNPAHLHPDGVCPYSSSSKETTSKPSTVDVSSIQIDQLIYSIEEGKTKNLTATILPDNATNKSITWKSSDENIATISSTGMLTAKKAGIVAITASTSNGKSSTIKLIVTEEYKYENNTVLNDPINIINTSVNSLKNNEEHSDEAGGILPLLGILGGGGYIGYRKYKK